MSRRIALPELLAATGYKERDLWELRRRGVFPYEPRHEHPKGVAGSASFYEEEAALFLKRRAELRRKFRFDNDVIWRLWIDPPGFRIDMRAWVLSRLASILKPLERERIKGRNPELTARVNKALRSTGLTGNLRNPNERALANDYLVGFALNEERPGLDLATPGMSEPSLFDIMTKLIFGFSGARVPSRNLKFLEERGDPAYWVARFQRIITHAFDREIEQARHDWRAIYQLVDVIERVDWNKVPPLLPPGVEDVSQSLRDRRARRRRRKPPPAFIRHAVKVILHNPDGRALAFCVLLVARRLYSRSPWPELPDYWLGIVRQWLNGLPRLDEQEPIP